MQVMNQKPTLDYARPKWMRKEPLWLSVLAILALVLIVRFFVSFFLLGTPFYLP